ncbi:hypothetical protein Pint_03785 [Pistacia integerrima]|uniref:Uncharacterized protein n=1 Tax=Pistacia integerrima TaxID=434235 RepID=A0ACC0Z609_9ROSI|nr:hypothetical protein Pint_03785 [Pistacia integerrima]
MCQGVCMTYTNPSKTPDATFGKYLPSSSSRVVVYCMREGLVKNRDFGASTDKGTGSGVLVEDCPKFNGRLCGVYKPIQTKKKPNPSCLVLLCSLSHFTI